MEQITWKLNPSHAKQAPLVTADVYRQAFMSPYAQLPGYYFTAAYQALGPIFRSVTPGGEEQIVLAGPEANLFMQQEGREWTHAREVRREQNDELGVGETLVSLDGAEHYDHRRLQKRGYSRTALMPKFPELIDCVRNTVRGWGENRPIALNHALPRLIAQMLGIGVINHPLGDYYEDVSYFVRTVTLETVAKIKPTDALNSYRYQIAKLRSLQLADEVIAAHKATTRAEPDLIDDLLANSDMFTEQELRIAVLGGYIGGLDTVAYTCSFMLYSLMTNPAVMQQLRAEVDAAFVDGYLDPSLLRKMPILHATALETLRLYPVSYAVKSTAKETFEFGGYCVNQGTTIISATTVPHQLEAYFPEPFTFDIDRYLPPRSEHRQPGVFAPYGVGAHICLGAGMAEVMVALTVATIVESAEISLSPDSYKLRIDAMPTPLPKGLSLTVDKQRHIDLSQLHQLSAYQPV